jgi:hypothetical protein
MELSFIYLLSYFLPLTVNGTLFHLPLELFFTLNGKWNSLSFTS